MKTYPLRTTFIVIACLFSTTLSTRALDVATVVEFTGKTGSNLGANPMAGLVSDGAGNLWGTTSRGGAGDFGTVFKIDQATGVLTTVVEFTDNGENNKGRYPYAGLVNDGAGNLWGTTAQGGSKSMGTVFKIAQATGVLTTVVEFCGNEARLLLRL
ncbi:MAG: hypothetical protein K8R87_07570 [Verrucomicrobia bacterium]|nr:hypothetical protein [Verrucomicrobiota bacterium]